MIWALVTTRLGIEPEEAPLCIEGIIHLFMRTGLVYIHVHVRQTESVPPTPRYRWPGRRRSSSRPKLDMQFGCSRQKPYRHPSGILAESEPCSCGIPVGIHRTYIRACQHRYPLPSETKRNTKGRCAMRSGGSRAWVSGHFRPAGRGHAQAALVRNNRACRLEARGRGRRLS